MQKYISEVELYEIIESRHKDPHHFLGLHESEGIFYILAFKPSAKEVAVVNMATNQTIDMTKIHEAGIYHCEVGNEAIQYKLKITEVSGYTWETHDAYAFEPILQELDLYLFGQGTHYDIHKKMGAHLKIIDDITGVHFAVWAPNAKRVSVVGDFCGWDGRVYAMRNVQQSGIYEIFIPGLQSGDKYKYEIKTNEDFILEKTDPYGNYAELRPDTASIVTDLSGYSWSDEAYMSARREGDFLHSPVSIYEMHLGSWKKGDGNPGFLNYKDLAHDVVQYVKELGYTHIELMPVTEHPFDGSWGYQVTGYYAPTSRFGTPKEFMYFVDYCHENGIGVILDWVPAHFPKDEHGLAFFDGTALYEHADPRQGEHPHWGTLIFNYGRNEVKNFLIGNALYWLDMYHIDGLRVDAVASMLYLDYGKDYGEWIPNPHGGRENYEAIEFFKHMNSILYGRFPQVMMVAEESTSWPGVSRPTDIGGLGFGMKWNMGWMNDFLRYIEKDPIHRQYHHNDLTFSMVYAFTENFVLTLSHDEVVHGKGSMIAKMPGDYWQQFANLRAAYGFMYAHPGKKCLFMGSEFAQYDEWSEAKSLDWHLLEYEKHQQMLQYVKDLNHLYTNEPALWTYDFVDKGFEWINCTDSARSTVSMLRKTDNPSDAVIMVANFTPVPLDEHRLGVPYKGKYQELINSDALIYGGAGNTNNEPIETEAIPWDHREQSIKVHVPPLGVVYLKFQG